MKINGFAGVLIPQTVTGLHGSQNRFRDGLTGVSDVTGNVRVVGLAAEGSNVREHDIAGALRGRARVGKRVSL